MSRSFQFSEAVRSDLLMHGVDPGGVLQKVYYFLSVPGFSTVIIYRLSALCFQRQGKWVFVARLLWRTNVLLSCCDISPSAKIGKGLFLPHSLGIVVGKDVVIGDNVTLYQNVTLGQRRPTRDEAGSYPSLGDQVVVGAGAVILGAIKVGSRARVGANAVVLEDVPEGLTVAGVPATLVSTKRRTEVS